MPSVITANRLDDGVVVYLAPGGRWREDIHDAAVGNSEDEIKTLEEEAAKAVAERKVVAVYPMDVSIEDGVPLPISVRERIRAAHRTTLTKDWYDVPL